MRVELATSYCSPDEVERNAECLLGHLEEVRAVLRRKGFSENAIEQAVTSVYRAAMPYITGARICLIENRRAWVFKVAIRAANRAAKREVRCQTLEPAVVEAPVEAPQEDREEHAAPFDHRVALSQLTARQRRAVQLCWLEGQSHRDAARSMGISAGTLYRHLRAAHHRLTPILARHDPNVDRNKPAMSAGAGAY